MIIAKKNYHKLRYSYLILHYLISGLRQNKVEEHRLLFQTGAILHNMQV